MWQIVKAEFQYNRLWIIVAYLASAGIWTLYLFDPSGVFAALGMPAVFIAGVLMFRAGKEKRERFHAILPVSIKRLGVARFLLFAALFQIAMLVIWPVELLIPRAQLANHFITMWELLALTGIAISFVAAVLIHNDFEFYSNQRYKLVMKFALFAAVLVLMLCKIAAARYPETQAFLDRYFVELPVGAVLCYLLCAALFYSKTVVFMRRQSFLS